MYRESIGIDQRDKFGIEIEFSNVSLVKIYSDLLLNNIPVYYYLSHKSGKLTFEDWYVDFDPTISISDGEKIIGGELSSRILDDSKATWEEIKKICHLLKKDDAYISDRCSTHVTVDVKKYLSNPLFLETLIKVLTIYENDINLFYMGDTFFNRTTKQQYAKNMSFELLKKMREIDFSHDNFIEYLIEKTGCFTNRCGVNFEKLNDFGLIEIRYGNGSLSEKTIQNYCNFSIKLLKAINDLKFDLDYLNYLLKEIYYDPLFYFRCLNLVDNCDDFYSLVDHISVSLDDQDDFVGQYEKVISSRNKK